MQDGLHCTLLCVILLAPLVQDRETSPALEPPSLILNPTLRRDASGRHVQRLVVMSQARGYIVIASEKIHHTTQPTRHYIVVRIETRVLCVLYVHGLYIYRILLLLCIRLTGAWGYQSLRYRPTTVTTDIGSLLRVLHRNHAI